MALSTLETGLQRQRSHDISDSGISTQNWLQNDSSVTAWLVSQIYLDLTFLSIG